MKRQYYCTGLGQGVSLDLLRLRIHMLGSLGGEGFLYTIYGSFTTLTVF